MNKHCFTIMTSCIKLLILSSVFCSSANLVAVCHANTVADPQMLESPSKPAQSDAYSSTTRWWQDFSDPQLSQLIESAMLANHDLKIATARLEQARILLNGSDADWKPRLDAQANAQRNRDGASSNMLERSSIGMRASWELDVFGRAANALSASSADAESARQGREATRIMLAADIASSYFELRTLEQRLNLLSEVISLAQRQLEVALRKQQAGLASALDSERWHAELAQEHASKAQLEGQYQLRLRQLSVLLGNPQLPDLGVQKLSMNFPASPASVLPAGLLERRPDVQRQARALDAALARTGMAKAELYPSLQISWLAARERLAENAASAAPGLALGYGLSVSMPILDGGRIRNNIALQDARAKEAMADYEKAILGALVDADSRLSQWKASETALEQWQRASAAAEQVARNAMRLFEAGSSDISPVLDARRAQFRASDALIQAIGARWEAAVALRRAFAGTV